MANNNNGGPAFPVSTRPLETECGFGHQDGPSTWQFGGMTLRDYFAAKAMQSYLTHLQGAEMLEIQLAEYAYSIADAMLKAREQIMRTSVILLDALRAIQREPEPDIGICGQVGAQLADQTPEMLLSVNELLFTLFKRWPKYSGLRHFPIPDICRHPEDAYHNNEAFWDRNTSYGALRWELLEFCIDQLENGDHGT